MIVVLFAGSFGGAAAQQRTREDAKTRADEARATGKSAPTSEDGGRAPSVTFQDVLAHPDDPEINISYARRLIAEGRLGLASATLERILLLNPNLDNVRLLYAVVMYRLDNIDEARRELQLLLEKQLSPTMQAEAERYAALIEARSNPLQRTASVTIGMHHDSNRNAYPRGRDFLVLGVPVKGTSRSRRDWGRIALGNVVYRFDTGRQNAQEIYGDVSFLLDDQVTRNNLDVGATLVEGGLVYKAALAKFVPKIGYNYIELNGRKYVGDTWMGVSAERRIFSPKFTGMAEILLGRENFSNSRLAPFATEQNGNYFTTEFTGLFNYDQTTRLKGSYKFKDNTAKVSFNGYQSHRAQAEMVRLLPHRGFLIAGLTAERQFYDSVDPFVTSMQKRMDTDWNMGLTLGMPFGEAMHLLDEETVIPDGWRELLMSVSTNYTISQSNIPNYDYNNLRFQALMTKRWAF